MRPEMDDTCLGRGVSFIFYDQPGIALRSDRIYFDFIPSWWWWLMMIVMMAILQFIRAIQFGRPEPMQVGNAQTLRKYT